MTLQECYNFCESVAYRQGQSIKSGDIISRIIPAPNNNKIFYKYIEYAFKTDNHLKAQAMTGAKEFEPLIIYKSPNHLLIHSWYWDEFPDEKLTQ